MGNDPAVWPELDYALWRETLQTLQRWTQIVGKVRLALAPWLNHSWHVPFYVTARGLGTSAIPWGEELIDIEFQFDHHQCEIRSSKGSCLGFQLEPMSVAVFYQRVMSAFEALNLCVTIDPRPNEMEDNTPFRTTASTRPTIPPQRTASGAR